MAIGYYRVLAADVAAIDAGALSERHDLHKETIATGYSKAGDDTNPLYKWFYIEHEYVEQYISGFDIANVKTYDEAVALTMIPAEE